jgi:hypothetical protein
MVFCKPVTGKYAINVNKKIKEGKMARKKFHDKDPAYKLNLGLIIPLKKN